MYLLGDDVVAWNCFACGCHPPTRARLDETTSTFMVSGRLVQALLCKGPLEIMNTPQPPARI